MIHKNFKNIDKIVFGRGSFDMLGGILDTKRNENQGFFLFIVDNYFKGKDLEKRLPLKDNDIIKFLNVHIEEPTTKQVDELRDEILNT